MSGSRLQAALSLALIAFGYSNPLARADGSTTTAFAFVNGGHNEATNYSAHEQDLLAFRNILFKSKKTSSLTLFNAAGPGTPVIPVLSDGSLARDERGWTKSVPSEIREVTRPATKPNIQQWFRELPNVPHVTVVYGGHGAPEGIELWDGSKLGVRELRESHAELPPTTMIRSIHLHSFGGAAIVESGRVMPVKLERFEGFMAESYPKNRCALALGENDELGQYLSWGVKWNEGKWAEFLRAEKHPDLASLKHRLNDDLSVSPYVVSTSDYFLRDLKNFYCGTSAEQHAADPGAYKSSAVTCLDSAKGMAQLTPNFIGETQRKLFCEEDSLAKDVEKMNVHQAKLQSHERQLRAVKRFWATRFFREKFPDSMRAYEREFALSEHLRIQLSLGQLRGEKAAEAERKLKEFRDGPLAQYNRAILTMLVGKTPEFDEYLEEKVTPEWVKQNQQNYPEFATFFFHGENEKAGLTRLSSTSQRIRQELRESRKWFLMELRERRRRIAEIILEDPKLKKVKGMYEAIEKCESSSLN